MRSKLSRRDFLKVTTGTIGIGLLAACSPSQAPAAPGAAAPTAAPAAAAQKSTAGSAGKVIGKAGTPQWTVPDLSGKTYTLWGLQYDPHVEAYARLTNHFQQMTGAKATVEPQGWPLETKVIAAMSAGLTPDVVCIMGKQCAPLVVQKAILPIDEVVNTPMSIDVTKWYSPVAVQAYQYSGKVWGVPVEGNMVSAVTNCRTDLLSTYGKDVQALWPPNSGKAGFDSFDQMFELAKQMQKVESDGTVTRWGLSSRGWDNRHLFGIMRTLGKDWWDPTNRTFALNSLEAVQAMQLQVSKPVFDLKIETQLDTSFDTAILAGKIAVGCGNVSIPGSAEKAGIQVDQCIYPSAAPGKKALFVGEGGWGFVVPTQAKAKDVGVEFLKYMSTWDGQLDYAHIYGGDVPGAPAVAEDPTLFVPTSWVGKSILRVIPAQNDTVYYGSDFGMPGDMETIVSTAIDNVRAGKYKAEEGCADAQKQLEDMLKKWDDEKKKM